MHDPVQPEKTGALPDALLERMSEASFYPHPVGQIEKVETHISVLFLTGEFVYKLKKPVDFGFLDFTRLEDRRFYCEEELRLNRRTAPQLYLDVVTIVADGNSFRLVEKSSEKALPETALPENREQVIDYAVRMRQFDPTMQLDHLLEKGDIPLSRVDELAGEIAAFHAASEVAGDSSRYGAYQTLLTPCLENFEMIRIDQHDRETPDAQQDVKKRLSDLLAWTRSQAVNLKPVFASRKSAGHIRECHGDLHLGNIAMVENAVTLFDCIEFSDNLRWIDTASDLAFILMDLESRNHPDDAAHLLNRYLGLSGDFELLSVLLFYKVYRAMVRAKVSSLQGDAERLSQYLDLACSYIQPHEPALFINFGFSGSGKTWGSRQIADKLGFVHIRSDVERKRLAGIEETRRGGDDYGSGLYAPDMSAKTYQRLMKLAGIIVESGFSVIVDATFLRIQERRRFAGLAASQGIPFAILAFSADPAQLEQNIIRRSRQNSDASDADIDVLHRQLAQHDALEPEEPVINIPFGEPIPYDAITLGRQTNQDKDCGRC